MNGCIIINSQVVALASKSPLQCPQFGYPINIWLRFFLLVSDVARGNRDHVANGFQCRLVVRQLIVSPGVHGIHSFLVD
ncbi:hypothetical protein Y603_2335 [Burkholderia pseudomallei MSHR1153]|nr:hypothetical protein Y603_2335 [Burkholderia pseudomallei MSHR1153]